ncbi:hypothetical protein [Bartonella sp. ML70XJBT.G]|uniref:hypothetical protein n=1 Tax=Bartonella sp. ML70XJBT.G TaxID=3019093 RepID=UPI00235F7F21|nr:hypothetical protein [Bartonella sp. ML70XJBT.G]
MASRMLMGVVRLVWGGLVERSVGNEVLVALARLRFRRKMTMPLNCPLAMGLLKTHIPFSTTVLLHAASFAVFVGVGYSL